MISFFPRNFSKALHFTVTFRPLVFCCIVWNRTGWEPEFLFLLHGTLPPPPYLFPGFSLPVGFAGSSQKEPESQDVGEKIFLAYLAEVTCI